jgi:hypothetical protein
MGSEYRFSDEDLKKVLSFTRDYHLELSKPVSGRTNQGARDFGGELDAFVPGKLIELGVSKIIGNNKNPQINLEVDYKIYTNTEVKNQADPDIVKVLEPNLVQRDPNLHVEIKRHSDGDLWLGMRANQLSQIISVRGPDIKNRMYMIHASLGFNDKNNKKQNDVLGSILKKLIPKNHFDLGDFSDFSDLFCKIEYAYSINSLLNLGKLYPEGEIIPTMPFSQGADAYTSKGKLRKGYQLIDTFANGSKSLKMKIEETKEITDYSNWSIHGHFDHLQTNTNKEVIYCHSELTAFNDYFGKYSLGKGSTFKFFFENRLEKGKRKNIDDHWFFIKRLDELILEKKLPTTDECLKLIAKDI